MIKSLQGLRFVFALLIFWHHFISPPYPPYGRMGVSFFFILSAFVLSCRYEGMFENGTFSVKSFMRKRILHILPLHVTILIISLVLSICTIVVKGSMCESWIKFLIALPFNILLIQSWIPQSFIYFSGLASWFLSDLIFLYYLFPVLFKFVKRHVRYSLILVALFLFLISTIPDRWQHSLIYIHPLSRCFDFLFGILLYFYYKHINEHYNIYNRWYSCTVNNIAEIAVCLLTVLFIVEGMRVMPCYARTVMYWIPSALLIIVFTVHETSSYCFIKKILASSVMQKLGGISFEIFMFHTPVIRVYRAFSSYLDVRLNYYIEAFMLLLITIAVSFIFNLALSKISYEKRILCKVI